MSGIIGIRHPVKILVVLTRRCTLQPKGVVFNERPPLSLKNPEGRGNECEDKYYQGNRAYNPPFPVQRNLPTTPAIILDTFIIILIYPFPSGG